MQKTEIPVFKFCLISNRQKKPVEIHFEGQSLGAKWFLLILPVWLRCSFVSFLLGFFLLCIALQRVQAATSARVSQETFSAKTGGIPGSWPSAIASSHQCLAAFVFLQWWTSPPRGDSIEISFSLLINLVIQEVNNTPSPQKKEEQTCLKRKINTDYAGNPTLLLQHHLCELNKGEHELERDERAAEVVPVCALITKPKREGRG